MLPHTGAALYVQGGLTGRTAIKTSNGRFSVSGPPTRIVHKHRPALEPATLADLATVRRLPTRVSTSDRDR